MAPPRARRTAEIFLPGWFDLDSWLATGYAPLVPALKRLIKINRRGPRGHEGSLYVANTDTLFRIRPDGSIADVVTGLPGLGDHQANYPVVGPDGKLYWGQGSVTNLGVVGADNFAYEWLPRFPQACDVPAQDVTLAGRNYAMPKEATAMRLRVTRSRFEAADLGWPAEEHDRRPRGFVRARLFGSGRLAGRLLAWLWPRRVWPVWFPAGTAVRGDVLNVPALQVALVQAGRLAQDAPWLPRAAPLLPVGLYAPRLRLRLLPP